MKKLLFLFVLMYLPMLASADAVEINGIYYNLTEDTKVAEVTSSKPNKYKGKIKIPESVEYEGITYTVTAIGAYAFYICSDLTSIIIPQSVTSIYEHAFNGCKGLVSVTFADSLAYIGRYAFLNCSSLTSLTIPNSVTEIGEAAFEGCTGLQSIVVENGNSVYDSREKCNAIIKTCDNELITGCMSTTIPNGVTAISSRAFYNCYNLSHITIPNSVTSIGKTAFYGCKSLLSANIPDKVTTIEEETFGACEALRSVYIPEGVTTIGAGAFSSCWHLTSVTIPSSVTFIDSWAFSGCEKLKDVYCYAEEVPNIRDNPFLNTNIENVILHVPAASVSAYKIVRPWKTFKEIVGLTDLDEYHPLLEEGKVWEYGYNNGVNPYMKRLTIGGDTIIGNQTYKKIVNYRYETFEMALREEGRKVYCYYPNQNSETLLYDFGKNAGDIINKEIKNGATWIRKVISVDTIMLKAKLFRCMTVHEYCIPEGMSEDEYLGGNYGYNSGIWVEGIGSLSYLDTPIDYPGNYYSFHQYRLDGMTFKQKDILELIANDIQPKKAVNRVNHNDVIYDLQGRRLQGEPHKGLYIQNGKKILK